MTTSFPRARGSIITVDGVVDPDNVLGRLFQQLENGQTIDRRSFPCVFFIDEDTQSNVFYYPYAVQRADDCLRFWIATEENQGYVSLETDGEIWFVEEVFMKNMVEDMMDCLMTAGRRQGLLFPGDYTQGGGQGGEDSYNTFFVKPFILKWQDNGNTYYSPISGVRVYNDTGGSCCHVDLDTPVREESMTLEDVFDGGYIYENSLATLKYTSLEDLYADYPEYFEPEPEIGLSATKKHFIRIS